MTGSLCCSIGETSWRRDKRLTARLRAAKLRQAARASRTWITAPRAGSTAPCSRSSPRANGSTPTTISPSSARAGVGKSWLACALGQKACRQDVSVLDHRVPRLFTDLAIAHGDGRYARLLRTISSRKLLILDDLGPRNAHPDQARDLLEIVEDRYDAGSLMITSQIPVDRWHDMIGEPNTAE